MYMKNNPISPDFISLSQGQKRLVENRDSLVQLRFPFVDWSESASSADPLALKYYRYTGAHGVLIISCQLARAFEVTEELTRK